MNDKLPPTPPALATSPRAMPKAVKVVDVAKKAKTAKKLAAAEKLKALEASIDAAYAVDPSDALAPFLAKPFARGDVRVAVTPAAPREPHRGGEEVDVEPARGEHEARVRGVEDVGDGGQGQEARDGGG